MPSTYDVPPGVNKLRLAVISDIHGNLEALSAVLADVAAKGIEEIICLGDLVNYGPNPNEIVGMLKNRGVPCVQGNHDLAVTLSLSDDQVRVGPGRDPGVEIGNYRWTCQALDQGNKVFLRELPRQLTLSIGPGKIFAFHASPWSLTHYPSPEQLTVIAEMAEKRESAGVVLLGHTHVPRAESIGDVLLCNPGSVGRPKDGDNSATYGILDWDDHPSFQVIRIAYDVQRVVLRTLDCGLPPELAFALLEAREI